MNEHFAAPEQDVAVSCRARLARNYADIPFLPMMNSASARLSLERVERAVAAGGESEAFRQLKISQLSADERGDLVARRLISPELMKFADMSAAFISSGATISIMVNEEDHVRIQGLMPGLQLERALELALAADGWLEREGKYAFDAQFGYLTANPRNAGTGMKASAILHLPIMTLTKQMAQAIEDAAKQGVAVRGINAEGGEAKGCLYRICNQVSLGMCEEDIAKTVGEAALRLINREREARAKAMSANPLPILDRIGRSLGVMTGARLMRADEFMARYSDLRLSAELGIIKAPLSRIDDLAADAQDAPLALSAGKALNPLERDAMRAKLVAERVRDACAG